MRPIVEIMTVNFSLLALDQIVNNAATLRHMSGGQVERAAGRAHGDRRRAATGRAAFPQPRRSGTPTFPGIKVLAPATVTDARYMLATAFAEPDPVFIFEHAMLYPMEGEAR